MKAWATLAALVAVACSGSTQMTREQLDSEALQLRSLAAEIDLLDKVVVAGRTTTTFAAEHAAYLHQAAAEHAKKLDQAVPTPSLEPEIAAARAKAHSLVKRTQ
ncbi:MAG: hypothetical protein ABR537_13120 [Gemmatimonadales bacterium]